MGVSEQLEQGSMTIGTNRYLKLMLLILLLHSLPCENFSSLMLQILIDHIANSTDFSYHSAYARWVIFIGFKMVVMGSDRKVGIHFRFHTHPFPLS